MFLADQEICVDQDESVLIRADFGILS